MSTATTTSNAVAPPPAHPTISLDFWGQSLPHIVVGVDDVRLVLQSAVKVFSGITNTGNLSSKMKEILAPYQPGVRALERRTRLSNTTFGVPNMENHNSLPDNVLRQ